MIVPAVLSVGCATQHATPYDYSAFEASNPHPILVLPPVNNSPDVKATFSVYAQVTHPLAEAGYYVLPVAVVNETFKQNGLTNATDIHNVDPKKLQQIFGADAALYLTITQYGSSYKVISSTVTVAAEAKLVDLKTGELLWNNKVVVVDNGNQGNAGGGIVGALVQVAVKQILNSALDTSYTVARTANERLLAGGQMNGLLYGPRSPNYKGRNGALPSATAPQPKAKPAAAPAVVNASTSPVAALAVSQTSTAPVAPPPAPVAAAPAMPIAPATIATVVPPAPPAAMARPTAVALAPQAAAVPAAQLSGPERRYAEVLRLGQAQHAALDPTSNWYRPDVYEWVMERKAEFIAAGHAPDVALKRAIATMESN
nr:DUF799 domain-containing protein [Massilia sp. DJPM01]